MKTLKLNDWPRGAAIGGWAAILLMVQTLILPQLRAATKEQSATPSKETPGAGITSAVEDGFIFEKGVFWSDVDVSTSKGIVTLSRSVDNLLAKRRAVKIVESIRGVLGVIDRTINYLAKRTDTEIEADVKS